MVRGIIFYVCLWCSANHNALCQLANQSRLHLLEGGGIEKQFPVVTTHWWPKTQNERFVWENEQYLYRFLPLVHNHVQVILVTTTNHILLWCCMNGIGICMRRSDWLTPPLALEKLKSFQLLPRAAPVKRRNGPTIQFGNAWRHSIQSPREALTPTPRVNGPLVCASAGKRRKWSLARIRHSLPERTHTRHTPDACAHSDHLDMVVYKR